MAKSKEPTDPAAKPPESAAPASPAAEIPPTFEQLFAAEIQRKMQAGLRREQAIEVIQAQLRHDQQEKAAAAATK